MQMSKPLNLNELSIRKVIGIFFILIAIIFAFLSLFGIFMYAYYMVVWQHVPIVSVLVLCVLFGIPLVATVLMFKNIGMGLWREPSK